MHPVLFSVEVSGHVRTITSYGVFAVIGIFIGSFLILRLTRKRGLDAFDTTNILALLVAGGIFVSLVTHFLIFLPERLAQKSFFDLQFGVISWGGVLGGFLTALWISRTWKIPLLKMGDMFLPGVALGFAIGRVGCHLAGCCFGLHYEGPLALTFVHPLAPAAAVHQPLFPIQLLSSLLLVLLCLILLRILRMNLRPGFGVVAYCLLYGAGRFTIEFFRNDPRGVYLGFSDAQWYSLALAGTGLGLLFYWMKGRTAPEEIHGH